MQDMMQNALWDDLQRLKDSNSFIPTLSYFGRGIFCLWENSEIYYYGKQTRSSTTTCSPGKVFY